MNADRPIADLASLRADLAALGERLERLENARRARPAVGVGVGDEQGAARFERLLELLQQSIEAVAQDNADLHRQLAAVLRLLQSSAREGRDGSRVGTGIAAEIPAAQVVALRLGELEGRLVNLEGQFGLQGGWRGLSMLLRTGARVAWAGFRRVARLVRRRLRAVQFLPRSPEEATEERIRYFVAEDASVALPTLTVLVSVLEFSPEELAETRVALRRQTLRDWEWLEWNAGTGEYHGEQVASGIVRRGVVPEAELGSALLGDAVCALRAGSAALPEAWFENALWAMACESLEFVWLELEPCRDRAAGQRENEAGLSLLRDQIVVRRDLWRLQGGIDGHQLRMKAEQAGRRPIGRAIPYFGALAARPAPIPEDGAGLGAARLQRRGSAFFGSHVRSGFESVVIPFENGASREEQEQTDCTVLLVPTASWATEETTLANAMVAAGRRFLIATLGTHSSRERRALDQLRAITPCVHTLGDILPPPAIPFLLADWLRSRPITAVLDACGEAWLEAILRRAQRENPRLVVARDLAALPAASLDSLGVEAGAAGRRYLVRSEAQGREAVARCGIPAETIAIVPPGIGAADAMAAGEFGTCRERLRRSLRLDPTTALVMMKAPLKWPYRAEDFVALAQRLNARTDLFFLLVGDGPQAAMARNLATYYGLRRFTCWPRTEPLEQLLAACDLVCLTAERVEVNTTVLQALAHGKAVVLAGEGGTTLLHDREACRVVSRTGDIETLAEIVEELADPGARAALAARAPEVVRRDFPLVRAAEALERALATEP